MTVNLRGTAEKFTHKIYILSGKLQVDTLIPHFFDLGRANCPKTRKSCNSKEQYNIIIYGYTITNCHYLYTRWP